MLSNAIIGRYIKEKSIFHKRNPILKIIATILIIISFLLSKNIIILISLGILVISMIYFSNLSVFLFLKASKGIRWIIYFLVIFFVLTDMGIYNSVIKIYQLIFILWTSIWLTFVTNSRELTYGIERILSPLKLIKIDVSTFAFIISLSIRFIPTTLETTDKILKSQASRGVDYNNSSLKQKFIIIKSILVPLFVISIKKSDELADAITTKSYKVGSKRTYLNIDGWEFIDTLFLIEYMVLFILICMGVQFL